MPLSLLEKENGLGVYCKGNENKSRSKRMLASSRNYWVKEEEERDECDLRLSEKEASCVGRKQGSSSKGRGGIWFHGSLRSRYGLRDRSSRKRFRKICLSDQRHRAECRIDLMPICLRTSNGLLGILKEKYRVRCLPKGHLTLTEQGKGHGKKCCQ